MMVPRGSRKWVLAVWIMASLVAGARAADSSWDAAAQLWYPRPAQRWVEALPLGNGRLGAMDYGGFDRERLQLNEDNVWAGGPYDPANPAAFDAFAKARALIFAGKSDEAANLLKVDGLGKPIRQASYQTIGELVLDLGQVQAAEYTRALDLKTALEMVAYRVGDVHFTRQLFASFADQVLVMHIEADRPNQINFTATFDTPYKDRQITASGNELMLHGKSGPHGNIDGQVRHTTIVHALSETGTVSGSGETMKVSGATAVTLLIAIRTNYVNYHDLSADPDALARADIKHAAEQSYGLLQGNHAFTYMPQFDRVHLDLGTTPQGQLPTDERVKNFANGKDPALAALEFQYGRYLLLSCSRPGSQPANLQGLWNDSINPPWNGKFTVNINTEMNYWPAEKTNLPECVEPLFAMIKDVSVTGKRTAEVMYHAPGWVLHHNTDGWRATAPIDVATIGIWPTGGAWLLTNVWEHYLYTGNMQTLKDFYPIYRSACEFFLATLAPEPTHGWLVTCPSVSPEHGGLVAGPTMDESILRDLFQQTADISQILGIDADFRQKVLAARAKLAPFQIGKFGQLQEWLQDIDKEYDTHRHQSHLYGMFPSNQITPETPALFAAAKKSLIGKGDEATGWSLAWRINLWARALDGNHAYLLLRNLLSEPGDESQKLAAPAIDPKTGKPAKRPESKGGTYPNLFDAHPPFQIDGNFGATSGITEMLMQSHEGFIRILPALPDAWPSGHVEGLVARGGFVIGIDWSGGKLKSATVKSNVGNVCRVFSEEGLKVADENGGEIDVKNDGANVYSFSTEVGKRYRVWEAKK
jgi:alpha-L-fucosidase 2